LNWLRYYTDTIDNPKIQSLPAVLFKFWANLLCVSQIYSGFLPGIAEISFRCRCPEKQAAEWIEDLKSRKLIDQTHEGKLVMHDWEEHQYVSDNSTKRVQKHRAKRSGNVSVTPPEQNRTEQNRTEDGNGAWLNGKTGELFEELWTAYPEKGRIKRSLALVCYSEEIRSEETHRKALAAIEGKWATSDKWQKGFILNLPEWIRNHCWDENPAQGKPPSSETRRVTYDECFPKGNTTSS